MDDFSKYRENLDCLDKVIDLSHGIQCSIASVWSIFGKN